MSDEIKKSFSGEPMKADAQKDIDLINRYALRELKPEEVFCFSMNLCDTQVDRDNEMFNLESLHKLAKLFPGKPLISDHEWSADRQQGRVYRCQVVTEGNVSRLRASIYMLRTANTAETIAQIEAGILREVSIGFANKKLICSICGGEMKGFWSPKCQNDHEKGKTYDGKTCVGIMADPTDAFEVSFVAVPSQREAGVTKGRTGKKELTPAESEERKKIFEKVNGITIGQDVWELIISGKLDAKAVAEAEKKKQAKPEAKKYYPDIIPEDDGSYDNIDYVFIPYDVVNQSTKEGVFEALGFCRKELELPPIQVKWFMSANDALRIGLSLDSLKKFRYQADVIGLASRENPNQILVRYRPGGDLAETKKVVFHESYHVLQMRGWSKLFEDTAYEYQDDAYERYRKLPAAEKKDLFYGELLMKDYSK